MAWMWFESSSGNSRYGEFWDFYLLVDFRRPAGADFEVEMFEMTVPSKRPMDRVTLPWKKMEHFRPNERDFANLCTFKGTKNLHLFDTNCRLASAQVKLRLDFCGFAGSGQSVIEC